MAYNWSSGRGLQRLELAIFDLSPLSGLASTAATQNTERYGRPRQVPDFAAATTASVARVGRMRCLFLASE